MVCSDGQSEMSRSMYFAPPLSHGSRFACDKVLTAFFVEQFSTLNSGPFATKSATMNKFAVVSGASSGIGYAIAEELGKRKYTVIGLAPENALWETKPLQKAFGFIPIACDLTNLADIKRAAADVTRISGGKVHVLFNNAGVHHGGAAVEMEDEEVERLFQINVTGHIYVTKYLIDTIIATQGAVAFTSSIAAIAPMPWGSLYSASKLAIDMYAKVLRLEMQPLGVHVYSVLPGFVNTGVLDSSQRTSTAAGSRYDVPGIYDSLTTATRIARDSNFAPQRVAKSIVPQILGHLGKFNLYVGQYLVLLYYVQRYFPLCVFQWILSWRFKQLRVWRNLRKMVKRTN